MDRRTFLASSAGLAGAALIPVPAVRQPKNAPISGRGADRFTTRLSLSEACRGGRGVGVRLEDGRRFFAGTCRRGDYMDFTNHAAFPDGFVGLLAASGPNSEGAAVLASEMAAVAHAFRGEADPRVHEALLACDALYGSGARTPEHCRAVLACMPRVESGEMLCAHTVNYAGDALRYLLTPVFT